MPSSRRNPGNRPKAAKRQTLHSKHSEREEDSSWTQRLSSVAETEQFGFRIGKEFCGGEVIALCGDIGAGKTTFVRGLASGLGIPSHTVTSPTFTLIHEYHGRLPLIHVDLYRIEKTEDLDQIGLQEYCHQHTTIVIEWAERMEPELPQDHLTICLRHIGRYRREATLTASGLRSRQLLANVRDQYPSKK